MGAIIALLILWNHVPLKPLSSLSWLLIMTTISSFLTMNFTGASTYTSLSGVKKEMRIAVPLQAIAFALGLILLITHHAPSNLS